MTWMTFQAEHESCPPPEGRTGRTGDVVQHEPGEARDPIKVCRSCGHREEKTRAADPE